jgi:hypothetical protein
MILLRIFTQIKELFSDLMQGITPPGGCCGGSPINVQEIWQGTKVPDLLERTDCLGVLAQLYCGIIQKNDAAAEPQCSAKCRRDWRQKNCFQ